MVKSNQTAKRQQYAPYFQKREPSLLEKATGVNTGGYVSLLPETPVLNKALSEMASKPRSIETPVLDSVLGVSQGNPNITLQPFSVVPTYEDGIDPEQKG